MYYNFCITIYFDLHCLCIIAFVLDCVDCDDIDRFRHHYVHPQKQYVFQPQKQYVVQPQKEVCHECETQQPQISQKPQVVYVTKTHSECTDCGTRPQIVYEKPKPQYVYVKPQPQIVAQKPQPQKVVYVTQTQTEVCHECETQKPQVVYTRPKPQQQVVYVAQHKPQPQKIYVTQTQTCHNCEEKQPHKSK